MLHATIERFFFQIAISVIDEHEDKEDSGGWRRVAQLISEMCPAMVELVS